MQWWCSGYVSKSCIGIFSPEEARVAVKTKFWQVNYALNIRLILICPAALVKIVGLQKSDGISSSAASGEQILALTWLGFPRSDKWESSPFVRSEAYHDDHDHNHYRSLDWSIVIHVLVSSSMAESEVEGKKNVKYFSSGPFRILRLWIEVFLSLLSEN